MFDKININGEWDSINNKPIEFSPTSHTHKISDIQSFPKRYTSLTQIDESFTSETPIKDVIAAMSDNSTAIYDVAGDKGVYPDDYLMVTITKFNTNRNRVEAIDMNTGVQWYTWYHVTSYPECGWKRREVKGSTVSLAELGLKNADFSPTDADANFKKILDAMGRDRTFADFAYDYYRNLDDSITSLFGEGGAWTICITTSKNETVPNPIYCYPNQKADAYYLSYDNWLRIGGKLSIQNKTQVTSDMVKNGWSLWTGGVSTKVLEDSESVTLCLGVVAGERAAGTVVCEGLPKIGQIAYIHSSGDHFKYNTNGTITTNATFTAPSSFYFISARIIK